MGKAAVHFFKLLSVKSLKIRGPSQAAGILEVLKTKVDLVKVRELRHFRQFKTILSGVNLFRELK